MCFSRFACVHLVFGGSPSSPFGLQCLAIHRANWFPSDEHPGLSTGPGGIATRSPSQVALAWDAGLLLLRAVSRGSSREALKPAKRR